MTQELIFMCATPGCTGGCEEAPGWCDACIEKAKKESIKDNEERNGK